MRRLPFWPTLLVGIAVATMIALGVWQLRRAVWKEGLLARYATARSLPPVALPQWPTEREAQLFRRSSLFCLRVSGWRVEAGRNAQGNAGWRHLATCRTGLERADIIVDMGVSQGFEDRPRWRGGPVNGMLAPAPQRLSLIQRLLRQAPPPETMLVADVPAPGFARSTTPSPADIPNNHRAYAVQWFVFAGVAAIIYAIALRRRASKLVDSPPRR